jgi:hypothetical protein
MMVVYGIALYAAIGFVVALAFVTVGIAQMMPHSSATIGARIFFLPGATALWPYILVRWLTSRGAT